VNNLFRYPYTKIEFVQHDLKVSRLTATKYLDQLAASILSGAALDRESFAHTCCLECLQKRLPLACKVPARGSADVVEVDVHRKPVDAA
jgi:hypothetical protein